MTLYLPKEMPEMRNQLARFSESEDGKLLLTERWANNAREAAMVSAEPAALRDADLIHVAPPMVELLMQAKNGIGEAGFMDYDLPVMQGMAYLAAPLETEGHARSGKSLAEQIAALPVEHQAKYDSEEIRHLDAASAVTWNEQLLLVWRYVPPSSVAPHGEVVTSWYLERDSWWEYVLGVARVTGEPPERMGRWRDRLWKMPQFVYDGHIIIRCHPEASEVGVVRLDGSDDKTDYWKARRTDMFRALCYLLRQRVAETEVVSPDRAARRRMAREGVEPADVRVIRLRGASASGGGDGSREYVHRWIVRGHWRRQWYRSIQAHRPVWITPYVKGPEDAPLLGGEKVYAAS